MWYKLCKRPLLALPATRLVLCPTQQCPGQSLLSTGRVPFHCLAVLLWEATGSPLDECGNFGHSFYSLPCTGGVLPALTGSQGLCLVTDNLPATRHSCFLSGWHSTTQTATDPFAGCSPACSTAAAWPSQGPILTCHPALLPPD